MDTQSRRIRLRVAGCRADSDPNPYAYYNANGDTHTYVNAYSHPDAYCYTQGNTEGAPNSASSTNAAIGRLVIGDE